MRLQQISEALGVNITTFFEQGKKHPNVSDIALRYAPGADSPDTVQPLNKEEIILLKLFRKTKNRKAREGIIRQLRGVVELENRK